MNERVGPPLLAVLSGLLLFAAFPPLDLGVLAWVALVPLLLAVRDAAPRRAGALGAIAGGVAFVALMAWMRVFGLLAWLLVAIYLGAYVGLFALLYRWIGAGRGPATNLWIAPVVWIALEYLRSIGVFGFPWGLLGVTQYTVPAALQIARYTGVFGVSFVVILASSAFATLLGSGEAGTEVGSRFEARRLLPALPALTLVAGSILWGGVSMGHNLAGSPLQAAAVQPDIDPRAKFDPLLASAHMDTLRDLTIEAGRRGAELIVLPETAIPFDLFGSRGVLREVGAWATRARATLVATSLEGGRSNIAVAVAPSGDAVSRYDKVRLVAFGEYGLLPGRRHEPLWTPSGRVGIAICFESIFPEVSRALVRNGAELLAVITNDGWFDGTGGRQHAAHSILRAVENGRWVLRAANTGITMVIDPAGRVRAAVPPQSPELLVTQVGRISAGTFYATRGDIFAWSVLAALVAFSIAPLRRSMAADLRTPAFQLAAATTTLPLISMYLLLGTPTAWAWPILLLAYLIVFTRLRPLASWGVTRRGAVRAAAWGVAGVLVLWGALVLAFRAYDLRIEVPVPPRGWIVGIAAQVVVAAASESWLRGVAFASVAEWKGRGAAVVVTSILGVLIHRGLGAEAMAWALVTGVMFGLIRAMTGNALGLMIPHALGNILFSAVAGVR